MYLESYNPTSFEEIGKQIYYTDIQPLWSSENVLKGKLYISR